MKTSNIKRRTIIYTAVTAYIGNFLYTYIASDISFCPQHAGSRSSVQQSSPVLHVYTLLGSSISVPFTGQSIRSADAKSDGTVEVDTVILSWPYSENTVLDLSFFVTGLNLKCYLHLIFPGTF